MTKKTKTATLELPASDAPKGESMTTKHTPGKWKVRERFTDSYAIISCGENGARTSIAWLGRSRDKSDNENLANARLMSLSPELLEVLEEIMDGDLDWRLDAVSGDMKDVDAMYDRIRQLIARAKGEDVASQQDKCSCCKKPSNDLLLCAENTALLCPVCREDAIKLMKAFNGGETNS